MTAWLMEVCPDVMMPSTGIVSPGRTRSRSPASTSLAGMISSPPGVIRLAVRGVRWTSFSIPARAFETVRSSRRAPSCMMKATSPAAKSSPMIRDATRAIETSTSALMSKAVTRPMTASRMIGIPHRITEIHARSKGKGRIPKRLARRAASDMERKMISFLIPPHSRIRSSVFISILLLPLYPYRYMFKKIIPIGVWVVKEEKRKAAVLKQLPS